jgi:hypothetical protein
MKKPLLQGLFFCGYSLANLWGGFFGRSAKPLWQTFLGLPKVEAHFAPIIFVETRSPFGKALSFAKEIKLCLSDIFGVFLHLDLSLCKRLTRKLPNDGPLVLSLTPMREKQP